MKKVIFTIIMWLLALFCCNCFVAGLFVWLGSLIFHYTLHGYAVIIGGCVISLAEFSYFLLALNNDHDDDDWYD